MKKIIFLFLIFSAIVFAEWKAGIAYLSNGDPLTTFTTYDLEGSGAYIYIGVNLEYDVSVVTMEHYLIKKKDSLYLVVIDNEGNDINCHFHSDDISNCSSKKSQRINKNAL